MVTALYDADANLDLLKGKTIAVMVMAVRPCSGTEPAGQRTKCYCCFQENGRWQAAKEAGFEVMSTAEAAKERTLFKC